MRHGLRVWRWFSPHRDEHAIAPGVRGWLESPRPGASVSDCVIVTGWAFARDSEIVDVSARGLGSVRRLRHGLPRHDVVRAYPEEPNARRSGFSGEVELDGPAEALEIWATLGDGRSIQLFKRRVTDARRGASDARAQTSRVFLASFLAAGSRLTLDRPAAPDVSVVVVVWNRAELTFGCLRALAVDAGATTEVIVVDNGSTDETPDLLARLDNAVVIRNASNLGFTLAANLGAKAARGEFLLFLNSDAELVPGSLGHLLDTARGAGSIGAVGGKLVFPDGRLQEAGAIIWSDGSCDAYGRGSDPADPEYNFERRVDFCSGALLLTPRVVFERLGGFDERYRPAYYEDADYCARLWTGGHSVVYQPKATAIHHEFGSATSREASIELQRERRPIFVSRHSQWLSSQRARDDWPLAARSHPHGQPTVVLVDDAAPDPRIGAGFPRAAALLHALANLGYLITIYTTAQGHGSSPLNGGFPDVEVVAGGIAGLPSFFAARHHDDLVIVSRPHNMQYVKAAVGPDLTALGAPCVYDAEAIYALREIGRRRLSGPPMSDAERQALIDVELGLTHGCPAVLAVSEAERQLFAAAGIGNVHVVGHAVQVRPTPKSFERRQAILFVGAFGSPESPNEDAVRFFLRDVLPVLRAGGCHAPIVIGGAGIPDYLKLPADPALSWHSDVDDLTPLYDDARVFVAPTRYAAGIPLKVVDAAAHGVPIVTTSLAAGQLGWSSGTELLAADGADEFARAVASVYADRDLWQRLRDGALARVTADYNDTVFCSAVRKVLDDIGVSSHLRSVRLPHLRSVRLQADDSRSG